MYPGILLVLEGIDGAGKSTQVRALTSLFTQIGAPVVATREPTDGPHGRALRQSAAAGRLPVEEEVALFEQDRRAHVAEVLLPGLREGALVIVDRYYYSTAAYQGIRGLDPQEIIARNESFAPRPDLLVVLDLPVETALARVRARGAEDAFERRQDLTRIRDVFLGVQGAFVRRVAADQPAETITRAILAALLEGPAQARTTADLTALAASPRPDDPEWRKALAKRWVTAR